MAFPVPCGDGSGSSLLPSEGMCPLALHHLSVRSCLRTAGAQMLEVIQLGGEVSHTFSGSLSFVGVQDNGVHQCSVTLEREILSLVLSGLVETIRGLNST